MLTLEQVRVVNDSLKSGDLNAALRPLEETIDLRSNELPRLDKVAVAALKEGLQNGDTAGTWAQALLHPNISVRRFARKVFMGLGDDAAPLFDSLRQRLERYWSEEKPFEFSTKPRDAALRREQQEMVSGALEILLRAHPEKFLGFYADVVDATPVGDNSNTKAVQEWQERNSAAWQATQKEVDRLLTEEWGSEWTESSKRWKLPSRVLRELDERARQNPEVVELWAQLGDNPYERAAVEWQPTQLMSGALGTYLSGSALTGPQQRVADRLRPVIWEWTTGAFDFESSTEERVRNARRLMGNNGWWAFGHWVGTQNLQIKVPRLLVASKPNLLKLIEELLASERGIHGDAVSEGDGVVARLWTLLVWAVGNAFHRPYNVKPEDWVIPAGVELDNLREIAVGIETNKSNDYMFNSLNQTIKNIEDTREAQRAAEQAKNEGAETVMSSLQATTPIASERQGMSVLAIRTKLVHPLASILQPYEVLADEQIRQIYQEHGYGEEAQAKLNVELEKVKDEMVGVEEPEKKVALLVQPPANPRDPNKMISRMPYWRVWSNALGEEGTQKLKDALWKETAPKLWELLDAKLQEYRRAETDPVEPKIEQKLTERELKEWRTQMRRETRTTIARSISDITSLLFFVDGFEARLKAIELADRPSCRDLRDQMEVGLINELERFPGDYQSQFTPMDGWDQWKLGEEWDTVIRMAESQLEKAKDEWSRARLERQLATGYYRRGQFDKFKEMAARPNAFPAPVAMASVALDDFEAWRVLLGTDSRGAVGQLTIFWQAQLDDPQRKERAMDAVVCTLASTSSEEVSRCLMGWLASTSPSELEGYSADIENALESSLVSVKKWAMSVLVKLPDFDRERAAATAGEALWSENAGLAKEAAKFLSQLAVQDASIAETVWESLSDATALDNVGVCEAVYRALTQVKAKNKELALLDAGREKLEALVAVQAERFGKFEKKLI
ncbi:hypothetical protein EON83_15045 [bacterium]|nr:MAG: hypothetical protein EON83_15045 [bacterium]